MSCEPLPASVDGQTESSALTLTMRALRPLLADPEVTELCINRPREAFVELRTGWQRHALPFADFEWCSRLAKLVANSTQQRVDSTAPLLSASLPTGERVQVVLPPATSPECVAIAIRRPADAVWSIDDLEQRGIFRRARRAADRLDDTEKELQRLLAAGDYAAFMRTAVAARKNILVSGPTGSGKTTWTKALIREISPDERLITIEDAQELVLDRHPNHVRLQFRKGSRESLFDFRKLGQHCPNGLPQKAQFSVAGFIPLYNLAVHIPRLIGRAKNQFGAPSIQKGK